MNLIDILNQILQTKNQIKDIISESDDFSRYSTSIHNYLADIYNDGYVEGYSEKYEEEIGVPSYPENPVQYKEYTSSSENYDPFTSDGLIDIMSDVLGYRLDIKDELNIASDYFPSYPEYLSIMINSLHNTAKNDGADAASEDMNPSLIPSTPSFSFSDNIFTLTPVEGEEGVNLYYKIGQDGTKIRYTGPVTISADVDIYYWASVGKANSSIGYSSLRYDSGISSDLELYPPYIYVNNNMVYIKGDTDSETILYSVGEDTGVYDIIYNGPFPISEDTQINAISIKNNIISKPNSVLCKYVDTEEEELPKCENVNLVQASDNTITMSCATSGATIRYRIDLGSWNTYSSSFTISERCTIYVYSSKDGYRDSDIIYYPITPYVIGSRPAEPTFYTHTNDSALFISCVTDGASIFYRIGNVGNYTEVNNNTHVTIYPTQDCTVYAFSRKNGLDSDIVIYNYKYYSKYYDLEAPTVEFINNRIVITSDYMTRYTLDGRDPRSYGIYYSRLNDGMLGIGISDTTTIRVVAEMTDENYRTHYSNDVIKTFTPIEAGEEGYIPNIDYFNVLGASEIHLDGTAAFRQYDLSYSYDKNNWVAFKKDVTGLDPSKRIYLQTYGTDSYKVFESIHFGENDRVTVAGNVLSVVMNGDYTVYENADKEMSLYKFFYECKEIVDAKDLCIPYKSLIGNDLQYMFYGCSRLEYGPSRFYFNEVKKRSLYQTFYGCSNLKSVGTFNITKIGEEGMFECFKGCIKLIEVKKLNLEQTQNKGMQSCFEGCSSLVNVSMIVNGSIGNSSFANCFKDCSSLKNRSWINSNSYIDNIKINSSSVDWYSFAHCFEGCSSFDYFGLLPAEEGKYHCYDRMFYGCSSLKEISGIGLTSLDEYSCSEMFRECSSLVKAPELLSHSLRNHCYDRMFYGCSSLNYIKALFLTTPKSGLTTEWVYGVADEGTFVQDSDAVWFEESVNAIPVGWTVPLDNNRPGKIIEMSIFYDTVTITADNDNAIYYCYNGQYTIDENTEWYLYTGPFQINSNTTITARCKSNRGVYGNMRSEFFSISVPTLVISSLDNIITISKPSDYSYGIIYYRLLFPRAHQYILQDWTEYTGPFQITNSVFIQTYGLKSNGEAGPTTEKLVSLSISDPVITCENNVVRISCSTENISRLLYKKDNDDRWYDYTEPFIINQDCVVYSYCYIADIDEYYVYSNEVSANCIYDPNGNSYVLHVPILSRFNNNNQIIVNYDGYKWWWEREDIKIFYKVDSEEWKEYKTIFNYYSDCSIQVYAEDSNGERSDTATYSFEYDSSNPPVDILAPVISVKQDSIKHDWLYIKSQDGNGGTFYTWIYIEDEEGDHGEEYSWGTEEGGNAGSIDEVVLSIPSWIKKGRIYCWIKRGDYFSDLGYYYYEKGSGSEPVVVIPDPPLIRYNSSTHYVSIEPVGSYSSIKYSFDGSYYYNYSSQFELLSSSTIYSYVILNGQNSRVVSKYCEVVNEPVDEDEPTRVYGLNDYLTFEMLEDGDITFWGEEYNNSGKRFTIYYSKNNGPWTEMRNKILSGGSWIDDGLNATIDCSKGDIIRFKGNNPTYHETYYDTETGQYYGDTGYARLVSDFRHNICGNIMSLINSTSFSSLKSFSMIHNFDTFFYNSRFVHLKELYLPAINLTRNCYKGMFSKASVGIDTSKSLPKSLPATTLADYCYSDMFKYCAGITSAPPLPATTLITGCYHQMFYGCSSLVVAPDLNARVGYHYCYTSMFNRCTNLSYSKCMLESCVDSSRPYLSFSDMYEGIEYRRGTLIVSPNSIIWDGYASKAYKLVENLNWTVIEDSN